MTDNGGGAFDRSEVMKAIMEEERNGVKLHQIVVLRSIPFFEGVVVGDTAEEVKLSLPDEPEAWVESFNEAWKNATDAIMSERSNVAKPRGKPERVACGVGVDSFRQGLAHVSFHNLFVCE